MVFIEDLGLARASGALGFLSSLARGLLFK